MSTVDELINQQARKAVERADYYENFAIPHYSAELHECLNENISIKEEMRNMREQFDKKDIDNTEKQLLLEFLTKSNENSKFDSIKESIKKRTDIINELDESRSKPTSRRKKQGTTN